MGLFFRFHSILGLWSLPAFLALADPVEAAGLVAEALLFAWLMPATALHIPIRRWLIDLAWPRLSLMLATRRDWFVLQRNRGGCNWRDRDGLCRVRILRQG